MNGINWQQVKADFGDANNAMRTGIGAISQAGTVFGELRKSILDQEQREIDNAYREKTFNENVRQFGLKHALDEDKFREDVRQFGLNYALNEQKFNEDVRHHRATENLQGQEFKYKVNKDKQDQEARKNFYNWLNSTDNAYKEASTQYTKQRNDTFRMNNATDSDLQLTAEHAADMDAKIAETDQKLREATMGSSQDVVVGYDSFSGRPITESVSTYGPIIGPEARELLENREAYVRQKEAAERNLSRIHSLRQEYDREHVAPVNNLPKDPISRAMLFEGMTGLPSSKEFMGALALSSIENAAKAQQQSARDETTLKAAEIRARSSSSKQDDKNKTKGVDWFTDHGVNEKYAGSADNIAVALEQLTKERGMSVSRDKIRAIVQSTLFTRTGWSYLPGTGISYSPKGTLGSAGDLEDILDYITGRKTNVSNSTKLAVGSMLEQLKSNK